MNIKQAKSIDMVEYLSSLGFTPQRISEPHYWYHSPLRDEKTPSFKVNRKLNVWKDWGSGEGGNIIDFGIKFHQCNESHFLKILDGSRVSPTLHKEVQKKYADFDEKENTIKILRVKPIASLPLIKYYRSRRIPDAIAQAYLKEVNYELKGRKYYALGFGNNEGGYELRNQYAKAASSPKAPTFIDNGARELAVFEGFFNFLSYQTMLHKQPQPARNFLILNSTSFFNQQLPRMQEHERTFLYLDNDNTGQKHTAQALQIDPKKFSDERGLYKHHEDLNKWLIEFGSEFRQQHRNTP
ncbi:MAG: DNA primase [Chitinophagaceae bacterium]|nr:MAG: DNA primase [Chitinophagaceae bacterium]